jgi:hypothetical protein
MRVETAIYGEMNGGHALRHASGDRQFARSIAPKLDIPSNPPLGVQWSPYVSSFAEADRYVLARTFPDLGASRSGMVRSHALIMPSSELIRFRNINGLLNRLGLSIEDGMSPSGFEVVEDGSLPAAAGDLVGAANALMSRGTGPVVRFGVADFERLIASLWANFWPEMRARFFFRLSFTPQDIVEDQPPLIVCTPATLTARWSQHRLVKVGEASANSASAAIVAGLLDADPLLSFGRKIGVDLQCLADLPLLERAHELVSGQDTFADLVAAVRLIERLSPNTSAGDVAKQAIADRLASSVASASADDILALRNLSLLGFPAIPNVWSEVERWFADRELRPDEDHAIVTMLCDASDNTAAVATWRNAITTGAAKAARSAGTAFPNAVWRWITSRHGAVGPVFGVLPDDEAIETSLASATPRQVPQSNANEIIRLSLGRNWFRLHGAVLSGSENALVAARRQIAVDHDITDPRGVEFALRFASASEKLESAYELRDSRIVKLAAQAVVSDVHIFQAAVCKGLGEQIVWDAALRRSPATWNAPGDAVGARNNVMDALTDGRELHRPLVEALESTPLADLCDYPGRERIWNDSAIGNKYIQATAAGWLRRAVDTEVPFTPDRRLASILLAGDAVDKALSGLLGDVSKALRLIDALPGFSERRFVSWLRSVISNAPSMSIDTSEAIGRVVLAKCSQRALDELVAGHRRRPDLKPALRACLSMIGFFSRWTLDLSTPTAMEKWDSFVSLASDLYPSGPDHEELWSRAGGRNSDLPRNGSGRSRWRTVLELSRNGRGPSPSMLIQEMTSDYPGNQPLGILSRDPDITGRR